MGLFQRGEGKAMLQQLVVFQGRVSWLWARVLLVALAMMCVLACSSPGSGRDSQQPAASNSPESEQRRRASLRVELASGYLEQGKFEVAMDEVNQALAISPFFTEALVVRGLVYFRMGDLAGAEQSFQRALSMNPAEGGALHNMGLLRCQQQNYKEASLYFRKALNSAKHRDIAKTWLSMGVCQLRAGLRAEAESSLMRAFELEPSNPIAAYNLGKLQYDKRDYTRARFYISRLNQQDTANAESLYLGVLIERALGNQDGVRQNFDQLRARYPNSPQLGKLNRGDTNE